MQVDSLKIKEFSDVHLGHVKTPSTDIINNLYRLFPNDPTFDCDIIFIAGDFFDRLLNLPDRQVFEIKLWITKFLWQCKKYDVVLRVLEGTPSHDWRQSKLFIDINEMADIGADVAFIDYLTIEFIERFGIYVLYVPDEWEPETDDTWAQVQQLLQQNQIDQIDFAVMHGAFDYQLPAHISAPTHDPERYLNIVKHYVFIGHVHTHSIKDRIIAAGSIDRLVHNEEEAKGYMELTVTRDGDDSIAFIENEGAKFYKTVDCTGLVVDKALKKIEKVVRSLRDRSHVRVQANKADGILVSMDTLKKQFPTIFFTTKTNKDSKVSAESVLDLKKSYQPVQINETNITKLLTDRLKDKGWSPADIERVQRLMVDYA